VIGLLAAGCGSPAPGPTPQGTLRLTTSQLPSFVVNGEPLTIFAARLENGGQSAVDLTFPSSCSILPAFETRTGQAVTPVGGGLACATVIVHQTLGAGQSVIQSFSVKAGTVPDAQFIVLPPGDYRIVARLADTVYRLNSEPLSFSLR